MRFAVSNHLDSKRFINKYCTWLHKMSYLLQGKVNHIAVEEDKGWGFKWGIYPLFPSSHRPFLLRLWMKKHRNYLDTISKGLALHLARFWQDSVKSTMAHLAATITIIASQTADRRCYWGWDVKTFHVRTQRAKQADRYHDNPSRPWSSVKTTPTDKSIAHTGLSWQKIDLTGTIKWFFIE